MNLTRFSEGSSPTYFQVCADIYLWNEKIGQMGVIHPNTLKAFDLPNPVSAFEINLEPFL
jgi:phenylalanyl-tRNA synthetase beta chain